MAVDFELLRHRLEDERKRLIELLETGCQAVGQQQDGNGHKSEDEAAIESLESWKRLVLQQRLREQVAEVEHALHKFGVGTYGLCDICGQPIAPERLEALPWASLCFSCKTRQARRPESRDPVSSTRLALIDSAGKNKEAAWQWWTRDTSI
jgi:RNA polymerase-binding transcription factor DksA